MVKTAFHIRRDSIEIIKNQGYDIINTAEVVRAIYTNPPNMIDKKIAKNPGYMIYRC